ncbi:MAG: nitroreductase family protein, partial [Myxococcota bacterium]
MNKNATIDHIIVPSLHNRWSPRAFSDRPITPSTVRSLFEAARWAPSCFNAQPWRFVMATRDDRASFERLVSCLMPGNQRWASAAGLLAITVANTQFASGKPNRHAWHDVGLAVAQLTVQATHEGLAVHQMAGIDPDRARDLLHIPEGYEPVTALAVGYPSDPDSLPEDLRARELAPRTRFEQRELVFAGRWSEPASFPDE